MSIQSHEALQLNAAECLMPDQHMNTDTMHDIYPGARFFIDDDWIGVDQDRRIYLYGRNNPRGLTHHYRPWNPIQMIVLVEGVVLDYTAIEKASMGIRPTNNRNIVREVDEFERIYEQRVPDIPVIEAVFPGQTQKFEQLADVYEQQTGLKLWSGAEYKVAYDDRVAPRVGNLSQYIHFF